MGTKVFISYKSEDVSHARDLAQALEARGIEVWAAFQSVSLNFAREIPRAISESNAVVVLLSRGSYASEEVRSEVALARSEKRLLLPYVLPGEPTLADADVPSDHLGEWKYFLALAQYRHWTSVDDVASFVFEHVPQVNSLVADPPTTTVQPISTTASSSTPSTEAVPAVTSKSTDMSLERLQEIWDRLTRVVSKALGNAKVMPRQSRDHGGGYRWVHLGNDTDDSGPYAAIEFRPELLGTDRSPLWLKVHEQTPRFASVQTAILASEFGAQLVQEADGFRLPLPFDSNMDSDSIVQLAADHALALRNTGVP